MADEGGNYLESSVPASIDIEEMLVGRLTGRQLGYVVVGLGMAFKMFKFSNHYLGIPLGVIIIIATYFLGFYKVKKYDAYLSQYLYFYWKYNKTQQVFLNK